MQRNELEQLIARMLIDGYESAAYRQFIKLAMAEAFSQENFSDMISLTQAELKKPNLIQKALVWELYLRAREGTKPYDPSNHISILTGMLFNCRHAFNLRALYIWHGINCDVDYQRVYALLNEAAALGHVNANYNIGILFKKGLGRDKDYTQARHYFELAAKLQSPNAYYALGKLAQHGRGGFKQDNLQALAFFKIALELGDEDSKKAMFVLAHDMFPNAQRGIDSNQAIPVFRLLAERDYAPASATLGRIYFMQNEYTLAKKFYKSASKFDHPVALNKLGIMYRDGVGVTKNLSRAIHYLKRAAKAGSAINNFAFVEIYLDPSLATNVANDAKIIKYLEKGVTKNEICCITLLAYYHMQGEKGLPQNKPKAIELWRKGHKLGGATCRYNLAVLRLNGEIDAITEEKAWKLLDLAIEGEEPLACFFRAELYARAGQYILSAKFNRKGFLICGENEHKNIKRSFANSKWGSTFERYHWYMLNVTETLPPEILNLYHRHPWRIIQAILQDDLISSASTIKYLAQLQLPITFLQHIKTLSISHPTRVALERIYEKGEKKVISAYCKHKITETELLESLDQFSSVVRDAQLGAYLTITILFDAILKNAIDEIEIPYVLARIYQCHRSIMRLDHHTVTENILYDAAHTAYLSLDAYLHLFTAHLQLIEAYVSILRQEIAKITHLLSLKQSYALANTFGLLMLTDDLIAPNWVHVHPEHLSNFSDNIKAINTPLLWSTIKEKVQHTPPQQQLTNALQFFHAGQKQIPTTCLPSLPDLLCDFRPSFGNT